MEMQLKQAGKRFNYEWIFRNLTFDFSSGSSYALLGPNGSGKSTLLQCLSGARLLNEGSYAMHVGNALVDPEFHYRHVSLAAPYLELIEEFTLTELMRFHATVKPFVKDVTPESAADLAQLSNTTTKPIKLYSSGMKQRVKLLLAILSDVSIVLLDEPATNLDAQGLAWYKTVVRERCQQRTLVIASNDPDEYDFCEHRINVLDYKPAR